MKAFFTQLFRPVADSEAATRKHLLWWMLLRLLLMSVLCITAALLRDRSNNLIIPPLPQTSFFLLALCLFSIFFSLAFRLPHCQAPNSPQGFYAFGSRH